MIDKQYKYYPTIENNKIHIVGYLNTQYDENSPLSVLKIEDKKNGTHLNHKIKLLDSTIKIVKDRKVPTSWMYLPLPTKKVKVGCQNQEF